MSRLLRLAAVLWVARWAVLELASFVARYGRIPRARPRNDREPGRMPGPFDR